MEFKVVFAIVNIFSTYLLFKYLTLFLDRTETNKKIEVLSYIINYCVDTCLFVSSMPVAVTSINSTIFIFLLSFNYQSDIKKRFVSVAMIVLAIFSSDALVYRMTSYFEVNIFEKNYYSSISGLIMLQIVLLLFYTILNRFFYMKHDLVLPNKSWILIFLPPLFSIYLIMLITQINESRLLVVLGMMALLFINFSIFYLYHSVILSLNISVENKLIKEQNESYLNQFEVLKTSNDAIIALKHDLIHKIIPMKALLTQGKTEKCSSYVEQFLEVLENSDAFSATGNFVFDSILNYKLNLAHQKSIKPTLVITIPTDLEVEPLDISAVLGNLLDNAINAVEMTDGDKWIDVNIKVERGLLIIKIKNPYSGENIYSREQTRTNKDIKESHGIGLKSVKAIVEKYDGVINIDMESGVFQVDLLLVLEYS